MEKEPKIEITTEVTVTNTVTQDENGCVEKEVTKTTTSRANLVGLSEDFLRDYFGLKVTIDWGGSPDGQGKRDIPRGEE